MVIHTRRGLGINAGLGLWCVQCSLHMSVEGCFMR